MQLILIFLEFFSVGVLSFQYLSDGRKPFSTLHSELERSEFYRPINIEIASSEVKLISSVYRFKYSPSRTRSPGSDAIVDLYSLIHIGEKSYYDKIQSLCSKYDVVLYELITNNNLIDRSESDYKKSLKTKVFAATANDLALQFNLDTQLQMDLQQPGWFIADLSKEVTICDPCNRGN